MLAKTSLFLLGVFIAWYAPALSQSAFPAVDYLSDSTLLDGRLDPSLRELPERTLVTVEREPAGAVSSLCTYRLGYTVEGLYFYLQVSKSPLLLRDRAYQNGDGFHLLLAVPAAHDSLTQEFLVLGFSPLDTTGRKAFVWYRNVDLAFTRLTTARCAARSEGGESQIELFLPWQSVPPYHPWLLDSVGFNLCYVEGSGENAKSLHYARYDERFQWEQHARLFTLLPFGTPPPAASPAVVVALQNNHGSAGDTLRARVAGLTHLRKPVRVSFEIVRSDSQIASHREIDVSLPTPPEYATADVGPIVLPPGSYRVRWRTDTAPLSGVESFTVLPSFDRIHYLARLERVRGALQPGSSTTIRFLIDKAASGLANLRRYDPAENLLDQLSRLDTLLDLAGMRSDTLAHRTGIVRRAYRSVIDSTLQPYTVRIPSSYSPSHPLPLLVYLHGSGQDDQGHFDRERADDGFIRLAPNGRGTTTAYSVDHAQDDIRETIADVCRNYAIDTSKIVLSGFSMGGYGVYRTHFETPGKFRALAVFSGSPDLATRWLGSGHPDFTQPDALRKFKGMRMFIFHGGRDRNCPVEETDSLVTHLRNAGALVEYHREEGKGHESPGPEVQARYREWLKEVLEKRP